MSAENVKAFVQATRQVFDSMLGIRLFLDRPRKTDSYAPKHMVTGVIFISGNGTGAVALSLDRSMALQCASKLHNIKISEINEDVADSVGELTNMIAGLARQQLGRSNLVATVPLLITGKSRTIQFPKDSVPISVPMVAPWGQLALDFGFTSEEVTANANTSQLVSEELPTIPENAEAQSLSA